MQLSRLNTSLLLRLLATALLVHTSQSVYQTPLSCPTTSLGYHLCSKLDGAKTAHASFPPILRGRLSHRTQHTRHSVRARLTAMRLSTTKEALCSSFATPIPSLSDWRRFHAMLLPPRAAARCCRAFTGTILFMPAAAQHDPNNFPMPSDPHKSAEPVDNLAAKPVDSASFPPKQRPTYLSIKRTFTSFLSCFSELLSKYELPRLLSSCFHTTDAQAQGRPKSPYEVLHLTLFDYYALVLLSCTGLCTALGATRTLDAREIAPSDGDKILRRELDEHVIRYLEASTAHHASQWQPTSSHSPTTHSVDGSPPSSSKSASASNLPRTQHSSKVSPSSNVSPASNAVPAVYAMPVPNAPPSLRVVRRFEYEFRVLALYVVMLHIAEPGYPVPGAQGHQVPDTQGNVPAVDEPSSKLGAADVPVLHLVELYSFGAAPSTARNAAAARLTAPRVPLVRLAALSLVAVAVALAVALVRTVASRSLSPFWQASETVPI
uniref:Uncharacterized protein n=1 Tax=Chrysotila carterae TaxID=13221 RepID=A0A6S9TR35_CHRCT